MISALPLGVFPKAPVLMGVLNVTPDSFSDGGRYVDPERAVMHGFRLAEEGAGILDIGGESTRPGAQPITIDEELRRVVPVLKGLRHAGVMLSIDTRHSEVMEAALEAGVTMVNDVSALRGDQRSVSILSGSDCYICLMHMQGTPQTMQNNPLYNNIVDDVIYFLQERLFTCETYGIGKNRLLIDPGIGFGKTLQHNLDLMRDLGRLAGMGVPLVIGVSRKRFIDAIAGAPDPADRLPGSLAAALWAWRAGVQILRVHDVAATRQALDVFRALEPQKGAVD